MLGSVEPRVTTARASCSICGRSCFIHVYVLICKYVHIDICMHTRVFIFNYIYICVNNMAGWLAGWLAGWMDGWMDGCSGWFMHRVEGMLVLRFWGAGERARLGIWLPETDEFLNLLGALD